MNIATFTPEQYEDEVAALESSICDTHQTPIPVEAMIDIIRAGRVLDIAKRYAFYAKKPDQDRIDRYDDEVDHIATSLVEKCDIHAGTHDGRSLTFGDTLVSHRLIHAILGIVTEAGELMELLVGAIIHGEDVDYDNLFEELGDAQWYEALARMAAEQREGVGRFRQAVIQMANIAKLKQRQAHPDQLKGAVSEICKPSKMRWRPQPRRPHEPSRNPHPRSCAGTAR